MPQLICDPDRIERSLRMELTDEEQRELESHLDDCDTCRRSLESAAAEDDVWSGVRESLSIEEPDAESPSGSGDTGEFTQATILNLLSPTDDDRMMGRLGTYEIVGIIGTGGMGVVLKAFDPALNRFVAIKLLAPHLGSCGAARKRFSREAQAAAAVVHDNVIEIHGVSAADGLPYLVMPYVRGPSLQRRLDDAGPLSVVEVLRIGMQAAAGLAAAHAQGLVHRDVKPANILLADGVERVKLTDFGLARAADDASLTRSGIIAGTPQYMSPEQARGESVDQRSDLFSLGSVLYTICTGRAPFRAETSYGVLRRITDDQPTPIREINPDIPEWLCAIISRLMSKTPGERFASAAEVSQLLEECLAHVQQPTAVPLPGVLPVPRETGQAKPQAGRFGRHPSRKLIAGALAAFSLLFSGILIVLELNKGTLTITSEADDVPIRITQGNEVVEKLTVSKSGTTVRVSAGEYVVEVDGEVSGIEVVDGAVRLKRGGEEVVRVVAAAEPVANDSAPVVQDVPPNGSRVFDQIRDVAVQPPMGILGARLVSQFSPRPVVVTAILMDDQGTVLTPWKSAEQEVQFQVGNEVQRAEFIGSDEQIGVALYRLEPLPHVPHAEFLSGPPKVGEHAWIYQFSYDHMGPVSCGSANVTRTDAIFGKHFRNGVPMEYPGGGALLLENDPMQLTRVEQGRGPVIVIDGKIAGVCFTNDGGEVYAHPAAMLQRVYESLRAKAVNSEDNPGVERSNSAGGVDLPPAPRSEFPVFSSIAQNGHSLLVAHDNVDVHYVLHYAGEWTGTASRSSHNVASNMWQDDGTIELNRGNTFGYQRDAANPFHLRINGKEYDLRQGRVLELGVKNTVRQVRYFPGLVETQDAAALAKSVAEAAAIFAAPESPGTARRRADLLQSHLNDFLKSHAETHPLVEPLREQIARLREVGHRATAQVPPISRGDEATLAPGRDPWSVAEKSVVRFVFVFDRDLARRAVPAIAIDGSIGTFLITSATAGIVPEGVGPAVDRAFVEMSNRKQLEVDYSEGSTADFYLYRTRQPFSQYRPEVAVALAIGDSLDAIVPQWGDKLLVTDGAARIVSLGQKYRLQVPQLQLDREYQQLAVIDRLLPEGTVLFKDGETAGIVLAGTRFLGADAQQSYVLPFGRVLEQVQLPSKTVSVSCTVLDPQRRPVANAEVRLYESFSFAERLLYAGKTDATGKIRFDNIPRHREGRWSGTLTVRADGYATAIRGGAVPPEMQGDVTENAVEMVLQTSAALTGRVVGPNGEPVAGAEVFVPFLKGFVPDIRSDITDENGDFSIDDLEPWVSENGSLALRVRHPNLGLALVHYESVPSVHQVRFERPVIVTGRVVDRDSGRPVKGIRLFASGILSATGDGGDYRIAVQREQFDAAFGGLEIVAYDEESQAKIASVFANAPDGDSVAAPDLKVEDNSTLDFLAHVPEFRNFNLSITEAKLNRLIAERGITSNRSINGDRTTYHLSVLSGENIVVMFRGGECSGIQRRMPLPGQAPGAEGDGAKAVPPNGPPVSQLDSLESQPLADVTGWVLAWDETMPVTRGSGHRTAKLRVFADGRVVVETEFVSPARKSTRIPREEVAALVDKLKSAGTPRNLASVLPASANAMLSRIEDDARSTMYDTFLNAHVRDPLPERSEQYEVQRVTVRDGDDVYDLISFIHTDTSRADNPNPPQVAHLDADVVKELELLVSLAIVGGREALPRIAEFANAELHRKIPETPVRLTADHFLRATHGINGTVRAVFGTVPLESPWKGHYPVASLTINVNAGGVMNLSTGRYSSGSRNLEVWGHDQMIRGLRGAESDDLVLPNLLEAAVNESSKLIDPAAGRIVNAGTQLLPSGILSSALGEKSEVDFKFRLDDDFTGWLRDADGRDLPLEISLTSGVTPFQIALPGQAKPLLGRLAREPISESAAARLKEHPVQVELSPADIELALRAGLTRYVFLIHDDQVGGRREQFGSLAMAGIQQASDEAVRANLGQRGELLLDLTLRKPRAAEIMFSGERPGLADPSPDGKLVALANRGNSFPLPEGWKRTVEVHSLGNDNIQHVLALSDKTEDDILAATPGLPHFTITALAFSPDSKFLAVGDGIGQVKLFDPFASRPIRAFDDAPGKNAAAGTPDTLKQLSRALGAVTSLAFSPDGKQLAVCGSSFNDLAQNWGGINRLGRLGSGPGRVKVFEVQTGELLRDVPEFSHAESVAFSADGKHLVVAGRWSGNDRGSNGTGVIFYDPATGAKTRTIEIDSNGGTRQVLFSPDGRFLAVAALHFDLDEDTSSTSISLYRAGTGVLDWSHSFPRGATPLGFVDNGKLLAVKWDRDQQVRLLDVETGETVREVPVLEFDPATAKR